MENKLKDAVLTAQYGPVWVVRKDGEPLAIELSMSGALSRYADYEKAANELVAEGLLEKGQPTGTPLYRYEFTERGKIAYWAIREAMGS